MRSSDAEVGTHLSYYRFKEISLGSTEELNPQSGGLDRDKVRAIASRLSELRKKWKQDQGGGDGDDKATQVLDAVLSDLEEAEGIESGLMAAEDVDLGLAVVEEMFEAEGSRGFSQVIASIRASLVRPVDESDDDDEPPPPVRFQPPPSSAVRARRPRPMASDNRVSAPASPGKGRFGWAIIAVFIIATVGVVAFLRYQEGRPAKGAGESIDSIAGERPLISGMPALSPPAKAERRPWEKDKFDVREEEMASLTLEIHLAEEAVVEGDLNEALRHFAAAATIDRHDPRVVVTGKFLVASMMREGDLAYDTGDAELARKRFRSARDLARGLGLEDGPNRPNPSEAGFEDVDPSEPGALQRVVGFAVRLTLKTGDVVYGRAGGVDGDHLLLDVYAGTLGGSAEESKAILTSTIKSVRLYSSDSNSGNPE